MCMRHCTHMEFRRYLWELMLSYHVGFWGLNSGYWRTQQTPLPPDTSHQPQLCDHPREACLLNSCSAQLSTLSPDPSKFQIQLLFLSETTFLAFTSRHQTVPSKVSFTIVTHANFLPFLLSGFLYQVIRATKVGSKDLEHSVQERAAPHTGQAGVAHPYNPNKLKCHQQRHLQLKA